MQAGLFWAFHQSFRWYLGPAISSFTLKLNSGSYNLLYFDSSFNCTLKYLTLKFSLFISLLCLMISRRKRRPCLSIWEIKFSLYTHTLLRKQIRKSKKWSQEEQIIQQSDLSISVCPSLSPGSVITVVSYEV